MPTRMMLASVCAAGLLISPAMAQQEREGQSKSGAQGAQGSQGRSQQAGSERAGGSQGQQGQMDRQMAIGHAVAMAIDGYALWSCAQKSGSTGGGGAREAAGGAGAASMRDASTELQQHAREAFEASNRLFTAAQGEGQQGQGGGQGAGAQAGQGGQGGGQGDMQEFYRTAQAYARTLQTMSGQGAGGAVARGGQGAGADPSVRPAGGGSSMSSQDEGRIALVNHAVKEAIEGVGLKQKVQQHGQSSEAARALLSHAQQMIAAAERTAQGFQGQGGGGNQGQGAGDDNAKGAGRSGTTGSATKGEQGGATKGEQGGATKGEQGGQGAAGGGGASIETLTSQGRAVIEAVRRLDRSMAGGGSGSGSGAGGQPNR